MKRLKAGQPKKFGVLTKTVSVRVPANKYDHYKKVFKLFVESKENNIVNELLQSN